MANRTVAPIMHKMPRGTSCRSPLALECALPRMDFYLLPNPAESLHRPRLCIDHAADEILMQPRAQIRLLGANANHMGMQAIELGDVLPPQRQCEIDGNRCELDLRPDRQASCRWQVSRDDSRDFWVTTGRLTIREQHNWLATACDLN